MTEPQIEFVRRNDSLKPTRVGVFSSSFNPPTKAHIAMCAKACQVFELQEIVLILTKVNADKELVGATLEQRKEMMLAVTREEMFPDWNEHNNSDMPHISVALCTHPRFIDVLTALKTWFFPPTQLHFIMGEDTLVRLFGATYYDNLEHAMKFFFSSADVIVFNRGSSTLEQLPEGADPFSTQIHKVLTDDHLQLETSSSRVRTCVKLGEMDSARELVHKSTWDFLEATNLYR
eukprot:c9749_g1_i1.p1 GENE.c9749_g1_i1~~c9749_g1_i1.p1  ORF type:complete len:233 (+),score=48.76 c9749_g1_i1:124-822(+)